MESSLAEERPSTLVLFALIFLLMLAWGGLGWFAIVQRHTDPGTFGDMFGAANALFSALAFATLIYTILLQRAELRLQRHELSETRSVLIEQRAQQEMQNLILKKDQFEASFFRVLGVLSGIVDKLDIQSSRKAPRGGTVTVQYAGRDCFRFFYRRLKKTALQKSGFANEKDKMVQAYADLYQEFQGDLGHYFRTLYNLIKLVDRGSIEDKRFYTNLVRAQLSNYEAVLIFYNCISPLGDQKFKPLVEEYALLKNMPEQLLINSDHLKLFKPSAFN